MLWNLINILDIYFKSLFGASKISSALWQKFLKEEKLYLSILAGFAPFVNDRMWASWQNSF